LFIRLGPTVVSSVDPSVALFAGSGLVSAVVQFSLAITITVLLITNLLIVLLYVLLMYTSAEPAARVAAARWLKGSYAGYFWLGLVVAGLVFPLLLTVLAGEVGTTAAAALAIIGGVFLRFLVVYSDDRRQLTGEARWWAALPRGDEEFLKQNWG
jgi:polysulfide reductase chain C